MRPSPLLLSSLFLSLALLPAVHAASKKAPAAAAPAAGAASILEVLKDVNATVADKKPMGPTLTVESKTAALTAEQWNAIAASHLRSFVFMGAALDDAGMERLAKLNPTAVTVNGSTVTGAGAAKFGEMKALKTLHTLHITKPTPEAKAGLSTHPALETFSTDGAFCIEAVTAPHLTSVDMKHGGASDEFVALLKNHPSLESVRLWNRNYTTLTDASIATLATLPKLKKLSLEFAVFTYANGLRHLKESRSLETLDLKDVALSEEDLAKLKADLPKVKITFAPMTAEYRAQWDEKAKKK